MAARQRVDGRSRSHVRCPGQPKNEPGIHVAPASQKCPQGHGGIGRNRWEDVFDGGQNRDQRVQWCRGKMLEKGNEVRQVSDSPPLERGPAGAGGGGPPPTPSPSPPP